jgi:hypothetical protein
MAANLQPKAGRPAAPDTNDLDAAGKAVALLQYAMDRANAFVIDAPQTSMVTRAARCARAGVPVETCYKALDAVSGALDEARAAVTAAYAAPAKAVSAKSRATL